MGPTIVLAQPFASSAANFAYSFAYFLPGEELRSFVAIIGCNDKTISLQFLSPLNAGARWSRNHERVRISVYLRGRMNITCTVSLSLLACGFDFLLPVLGIFAGAIRASAQSPTDQMSVVRIRGRLNEQPH